MTPVVERQVFDLKAQGFSYSQIAQKAHISKATVCRIIKGRKPDKAPTKQKASSLGKLNIGLTRDQVQERHDTPARIVKALDEIIAGFEDGMAYEENEVKRLCRISMSDGEYWSQITDEPQYREYYGFSEKNVRLWGTKKEVAWMEENLTGFRRA